MGLLDVVLIVNIILKIIGIISWSWWVVLWPLWVDFIIIISILWAER